FEEDLIPPVGEQQFHGLPFRVGAETPVGSRYIGFGTRDGLNLDPVTVPIGQTARRLLFAHALLESKLMEGGPMGLPVAHYVFRYNNDEEIRPPIRERFEVAVVPVGWGQHPFLAVPAQKDSLQPRYEGLWGNAGTRQA